MVRKFASVTSARARYRANIATSGWRLQVGDDADNLIGLVPMLVGTHASGIGRLGTTRYRDLHLGNLEVE